MDKFIFDKVFDGVYYWFVWAQIDGKHLRRKIAEPEVTKLMIMGFEEYEVMSVYGNKQDWDDFLKYAAECNVEVFLIRPAYLDTQLNYRHYITEGKNLIQYMHYFGAAALHTYINSKYTVIQPKVFKKTFTSLNNKGHIHRCIFFDEMYKQNQRHNGFVSWGANDINWDYKWKYFDTPNIPQKLDWESVDDPRNDILFPPKQFGSSLWSVVCESNTECIFTTEKTYIPILHKRPFVTYAVPNFNKALKKLGFKLFDEYIDYSFDSIDNDRKRAEEFWKQINKLHDLDHAKVKEELQEKIDYNFNWLCTMCLNPQDHFPKYFLDMVENVEHLHMKEVYKPRIFIDRTKFDKWCVRHNFNFKEIK